jgi:hypothetical protein
MQIITAGMSSVAAELKQPEFLRRFPESLSDREFADRLIDVMASKDARAKANNLPHRNIGRGRVFA